MKEEACGEGITNVGKMLMFGKYYQRKQALPA
jgi:hypothetical protein